MAMGKEMAGCMWGEDILRAHGQAPDDSGHPAANSGDICFPGPEPDKSGMEVAEKIRLKDHSVHSFVRGQARTKEREERS